MLPGTIRPAAFALCSSSWSTSETRRTASRRATRAASTAVTATRHAAHPRQSRPTAAGSLRILHTARLPAASQPAWQAQLTGGAPTGCSCAASSAKPPGACRVPIAAALGEPAPTAFGLHSGQTAHLALSHASAPASWADPGGGRSAPGEQRSGELQLGPTTGAPRSPIQRNRLRWGTGPRGGSLPRAECVLRPVVGPGAREAHRETVCSIQESEQMLPAAGRRGGPRVEHDSSGRLDPTLLTGFEESARYLLGGRTIHLKEVRSATDNNGSSGLGMPSPRGPLLHMARLVAPRRPLRISRALGSDRGAGSEVCFDISTWHKDAVGYHDIGGSASVAPVRAAGADRVHAHWELRIHALVGLLVSQKLLTVDELRRGIEGLRPADVAHMSYYHKWAASITVILLERGILGQADVVARQLVAGGAQARSEWSEPTVEFEAGQAVRVKTERELHSPRWRRPHLRTPGYIHGARGVVERVCGVFDSPEVLAFGGSHGGAQQPLYRVRFSQSELWTEAASVGGSTDAFHDTVDVEVYQHWLEGISSTRVEASVEASGCQSNQARHELSEHSHGTRAEVEAAAVELEQAQILPEPEVATALLAALLDGGIVEASSLARSVEAVERLGSLQQSGQQPPGRVGAALVARAWLDSEFKGRLLADASSAAAEMDLAASNATAATVLTAVENTHEVHNLVVCTLCSCYPLPILGLSPAWYKSAAYRARAVREPRQVLAEFGTVLPSGMRVQVHDSTADLRYMVLPRRPAGTEGMSELELRELVSRDAMIGVRVCAKFDTSKLPQSRDCR